jgi:hypothetical protein
MIPMLPVPIREWWCPACGLHDQTQEARPHTRYHTCPKLRYLSIPLSQMPEEGIAAKIEARDIEDYVGRQLVQVDGNGRPVMSVVTTRDNGQDCAVYPPTATAGV